MALPETLLYIHGFLSSGSSQKGLHLKTYLQQSQTTSQTTLLLPTLPDNPKAAMILLESLFQQYNITGIVGSSLGGFYATVLCERMAEQYNCKAALINPAVYPYTLIETYLGENQNPYTTTKFTLTHQDIQDLKAMEPTTLLHPKRISVFLQSGDEVLDYQLAVKYYQNCTLHIRQGGSHQFEDFSEIIPELFLFFSSDT